jgi:cell wall-associated NlpC family hydrolase
VSANRQLATLNTEVARDNKSFQAMRSSIAQIASTSYENSDESSIAALLTANDPQTVLDQTSILTQLSSNRSAQINQFVASARQLTTAQQRAKRTQAGIAALDRQKAATKQHFAKLVAQQQALLNNLTAQQAAAVQAAQAAATASTIGAGGSTSGTYTGPTGTQADQAVAFAYNALGTPYVYGGTGGASGGYDCSGLVQAAWASAGISIPRDTYSQYAALPHIPSSAIQPGDLMYYDGIGHVAMYVGGGMIIDAPQPGMSVEKISMNESWYANSFDGAARP